MEVVPETSIIFIHLTWVIVEKDFIIPAAMKA
jgi:hypothetical protein